MSSRPPVERASCSHAFHALLRSNPSSFERETVGPFWILEDEGARWRMGQCRNCMSTLSLELPRPAADRGRL